ncbi:RadC family protein [Hydrogenobacter hydrogenophilus]|uniref:DNA repair protein RadC n=1 Tax=Hydrogenobacter hydrogenophilus TaxID=35835 RepID=A0A285NNU2_9AQUI|nr:DNA repair protein RadC [Hydrogenobacter hydrogenophilus]SNZ11119.1 DNA repair protein RadC [Hydrogenobacter hydrogenophilus]
MYRSRKLKEIPQELRPREKLRTLGVDALSDEELVAIILGFGTKKDDVLSLSKKIVRLGWERLKSMSVEEMVKEIEGIGEAKACQIKAIFELSRRIYEPHSHVVINTPEDVYKFLKDKMDNRREHLWALYLSPSNTLVSYETVAIGRMNSVFADPKDVLYGAIKSACHSIILAHSHPMGQPKPSKADLEFTKRIKDACQLLGFELLDHIIITTLSYFSMKEGGFL